MFSYRDRYFQRKETEEKVLIRRLVHKDQTSYIKHYYIGFLEM